MSVIIRLQNLPLTANSIDIRTFFRGLSIPDGGVHIVGGREGDAFIAFSTDEDARQAMQMSGNNLQESTVRLLLSSRNEMFKVIEQARQKTLGIAPNNAINTTGMPGPAPSSTANVSASTRDPGNSSTFQSHPMQLSNTTNNPLMGSQSGLASSTNAFGIPNMTAFTGVMNMNNSNIPPGISPFSTMSNVGQMPHQMNSMIGHTPGGPQNIYPQGVASATQPGAGRGQNQTPQYNNIMSPFGMPPLITTGNQPSSLGFPAGLIPSGPPPMIGQHQTGQGLSNHQMHLQMGNSGSGLGLNNQLMNAGAHNSSNSSGASGNLPGPYQSSGQRMGMGSIGSNSMVGQNSTHPSAFIMGQSSGIGHQPNSGEDIMSSGSSAMGMEQGISGGRERLSRFQQASHNSSQDNSEDNGFSNSYQGRGRSSGGRDGTRGRQGFGTFGRPDTGAPTGSNRERDRDQFNNNSRDRGDRSFRRSRSKSRDRRDSRRPPINRIDRSREDIGRDNNRRHRRTKSKSRSRSRERERSGRMMGGTRRNSSLESRDKNNSSPEKSKNEGGDDSKNSSGNDDVLIISEGTEEEFPCIKVSGLPRDITTREIKEMLRIEFRGGNDAVVRNYDEGIAFIRLEKSSEFSKAFRQNGRKMGNSIIRVDGILLEAWDTAYNAMRRQPEREQDKGFDRDRNRGRENERERDRDRDGPRDPRDRGDREFRVRDAERYGDRDNNSMNSECCLLIRGLPPAFSSKDVALRILVGVKKWVYSDIVLVPDENENGRAIANAYVQIMSTQEAQRAMETISESEEGASLRTQILSIDELERAKKMGETIHQGFKDKDSSRFASVEAKSLFDLDIGMDSESSSVILRGCPANMSERDVVDFFSDIGLTPMNVRMLLDMNGQVICEFQDSHRARRATTKDGMAFGRSTISVQLVPGRGSSTTDVPLSPSSSSMNGPSTGSHSGWPQTRGGPRGAPAGILGMRPPRFPNPLHRTPNPFVQAMQHGMRPRVSGGPRMRGGVYMGRGGPRMSSTRPTPETGKSDAGGGNDEQLTVTSNFHLESLFEKTGCVVAVTNIPYSASMDDILRFLDGLLQTKVNRDRIIRRYNEFQQATGDARIAFDSPFEAKRAHDLMQGSTMWNRKLEVSLPSEF